MMRCISAKVMADVRAALAAGTFAEFRRDFVAGYIPSRKILLARGKPLGAVHLSLKVVFFLTCAAGQGLERIPPVQIIQKSFITCKRSGI